MLKFCLGLLLASFFFPLNLCLAAEIPTSTKTMTDEYNYRTLDAQGETVWQLVSPNPRDKKAKPEDSYKALKVTKKIIPLGDLLKKEPQLAQLKSIALIGDTGCRLKESLTKSTYQDCSDPKQWRYPEVINSLSQEHPDLIIHVGDYHYREQCSPGKPCEKMSAEIGYGWGPWKLDFFDPSKKAFAAAPWLIVRGNHEDCQRAFLGYRTLLQSIDWKAACEDYEEPQIIVLGDLAIINLDSSGVNDMPEFASATEEIWKKRMDAVGMKLKSIKAKHIWLVTHKPLYGLVALGKAYAPVNVNLRKYFEASSWSSKVELIFAGHIHNSQIVRVKDEPLQIVLGNGGTALDASKDPVSAENLSALNYEKAKMVFHDFGYAIVRGLDIDKAVIEFHDSAGGTVFTCHLKDKGQDCL